MKTNTNTISRQRQNQNKDTHHTLDYLQNEQGLVCAQCRGWSIKLPLHKTFLQCAHVAAHCARTLQGLPLHKTFLRAKHTRLQRQQAGGGRSAQSFLRDFWQHKCTIQFLCSTSAQAIEASSWKSSCMRKQRSNSSSTVFKN